ncbi:hypothetical protein KY358_00150 [Candidatus Woesearchaeota archaeon]|nr:hypothetical protein [Candidatus Woesearchaeota archaeon]
MEKNWKKETARDCIALGSIPFYLIVIVRAVVGEYAIFVYQLLIALGFLWAMSFAIKKAEMHTARCFALWFFTSLFYQHALYTLFAFLLGCCVVFSSYYLGVKKGAIIKGVALGIISSGAAYYLALLIPA